jgi:soluble epoxide hydrolase/lipid-phosphate phosphatase
MKILFLRYGWRYQIGPWTAKGYRVVVPDMLGYGSTDAPSDAHNYTSKSLCDDLASLLDLIGIKKAVCDLGCSDIPLF